MTTFQQRRTFLIFLSAVPLLACTRKIDTSPRQVKWDKDSCARCAMLLSDRMNSAQIIDPETGEAFLFDDFGCAIAWLDEKNPGWRSSAIIYVNDATDGSWLKPEEAVLATPYVTPMSFGISAFRNKENIASGKTVVSMQEAQKIILDNVRAHQQNKTQPS